MRAGAGAGRARGRGARGAGARGALCGRARARVPGALMVLHSGDTTVSFPMTPEAARGLRGGLDELDASFRGRDELRESGGRPKKLPSMDYEYPPEEVRAPPAPPPPPSTSSPPL